MSNLMDKLRKDAQILIAWIGKTYVVGIRGKEIVLSPREWLQKDAQTERGESQESKGDR